MTESRQSYSVAEHLALRLAATLRAAGLYEFDRRVLGLEEGLSVVITLTAVLWWAIKG